MDELEYESFYFDTIGELGLYQIIIAFATANTNLFSPTVAYNFLTTKPDHWCNVAVLSQDFSFDQQKYIAIPTDDDGNYKQCERFDLDFTDLSAQDFYEWIRPNSSTPTVRCDEGWMYDRSEYSSSLITKFDLVCGKDWLIALPASLSFAGMLLAGPSAGFISDTFGRKACIIYFMLWTWGSYFLIVFGNHYWMYVLGWLISSYGEHGVNMVKYVLCTELVGKKYRSTMNIMTRITFMLLTLISTMWAYFFKDALVLHLATLIPNVLCLFIVWSIPESPRWLIVKGKYKEASKIMGHIAAVNNRPTPDNLVEKLEMLKHATDQTKLHSSTAVKGCSTHGFITALKKVKSLLATPEMRKRTIIVTIHWMADVLMYYALSYNYRFVPGNIIVVAVIVSLLDLPNIFLSIFFVNWRYTGRRISCALTMLFAGLAAFAVIPFQYFGIEAGETTFILLGRLFISMAFSCIYVYTPELHPTEARNTGMGFSSMFARVGGVAAPYIGGPLKEIQPYFPNILFGAIGVTSGGLTFLLPETLGKSLPDTLEDVQVEKDKSNDVNAKELKSPPPYACENTYM